MTTITFRGALTIGSETIRCPGMPSHRSPHQVTLLASGSTVNATCGQKHRSADGGGRRAQCFFPVPHLTPANLATLAKAKPGRVRLTLTNGKTVTGNLAAVSAGSSAAAKAAQAAAAKTGKSMAVGPAKPAKGATGGALVAAFGAIAAVAGAAGQAVGAAGQVAAAGASAVGSVADLGREGVGLARDGVREAGAYGERRHERKMNAPTRYPGVAGSGMMPP